MGDWSNLPYDLIKLILNRIKTIEDFVSFSAVCRSWNSTAIKANWISGPQLPWLMLAENKKTKTRDFFSFHTNKRYDLKLRETHRMHCFGSPHGWLLMITLTFEEITLINPITKAQINLPPIPLFENEPKFYYDPRPRGWILSVSESFFSPFLAVAIRGGHRNLALILARPLGQKWIHVKTSYRIEDIVYYNGQIFAIDAIGALLCYESNYQTLVHFALPPEAIMGWNKIYLVESLGDLLVVLRIYGRDDKSWYKTIFFQVYKLDLSTRKWIELEDLGDEAFFVGDNTSISVSSSKAVNCRGNCIYFTDDNREEWHICQAGHDMGVFDMKDSTIEPHYIGDDSSSCFSCPIWVMITFA